MCGLCPTNNPAYYYSYFHQDMADRKVLASDRNVKVARTFYESALADYDHALVLDPQVRGKQTTSQQKNQLRGIAVGITAIRGSEETDPRTRRVRSRSPQELQNRQF